MTDRPMEPDELLHLDDEPAREDPPDELVRLERRNEIELDAIGGGEVDLDRVAAGLRRDDGVRLLLPPGVVPGRRGRSTGRLDPRLTAELPEGGSQPFRPPWLPFTAHPRLVRPPRPRRLVRADGRRVDPHYGVFPPDDRLVYWPAGYPWRCIGRVFVWNDFSRPFPQSSASAVLVGPRVLLTAGHVVPWGSGNWAMQFVPAYWDGSSLEAPGLSSWVSDCNGWDTDDDVEGNDIAVCRLYDPLGSSLGWFGTRTYHDDWEDGPYWTLCGYPGMVAGGNRPSFQSSISVYDDDGGPADTLELEHFGDSSDGNSGGPFFGWWDGSPFAIGTQSGGESFSGPFGIGDEDHNVAAGGRGMVNLVKWALNAWPA